MASTSPRHPLLRELGSALHWESCAAQMGFPKIRGAILEVPIIRTLVLWVLYWGPPYFGKQPSSNPDKALLTGSKATPERKQNLVLFVVLLVPAGTGVATIVLYSDRKLFSTWGIKIKLQVLHPGEDSSCLWHLPNGSMYLSNV